MALRWDQWRGSWQGWQGGLLAGSVVAYDRSEMRVLDASGLRRLVITGQFWAGFLAGERVEGEHENAAGAMAAVDAAHAMR
jgi:hypothetical protein